KVASGGKACGEILTSRKALADAGGDQTARVFEVLARQGKRGPHSSPKPCEQAFENLSERFSNVGLPLRTHMNDGHDSQIVRIDSGVHFKPGTFSAPDGYKRQSLEDIMSHH
ncbi:MAG TPA: hypothetical protein VKA48_08950, partial [Gammaproteobacteria bacterium]|nr:hypothetical protein [Gammaproteobacteria bacterium]